MNTNSLLKGNLQTIILKFLEDSGEMYGYEITQRVKEMTNGAMVLTQGALYPTLHKLEADGLLETHTKNVNNRIRKYYSLTQTGKKETTSKLKEVQEFMDQLQALLNLKPSIS